MVSSYSGITTALMSPPTLLTGEPLLDLCGLVDIRAVWNQWNGTVEWNSGMEYWNDL
jgi:hypothetical protein